MERPQTPDHCQDRIARAEDRLRAATMRMSQAQELLALARQRLAVARLTLEDGTPRGTVDLPPYVPMKPQHTP